MIRWEAGYIRLQNSSLVIIVIVGLLWNKGKTNFEEFFNISVLWVKRKQSWWSRVVKYFGIGVLSLEYSVGSGFFYCGGWVGGFGGGNGL